jgi:hypothetical protein
MGAMRNAGTVGAKSFVVLAVSGTFFNGRNTNLGANCGSWAGKGLIHIAAGRYGETAWRRADNDGEANDLRHGDP